MFELIRSNKRRSIALVAAFTATVALVGAAVGLLIGNGLVFTLVALALGALFSAASYWKADAIALRVSRARPADSGEYARLHNLIEGLCVAGGLPKPRVYVIDDPAPKCIRYGSQSESRGDRCHDRTARHPQPRRTRRGRSA